ncbi:MAG: MOSC domain-containing protein [Planctomycetaceae bacterium]
MPHLARIQIFPIKSLDPLSVQTARVLPAGALEFDRRFALADAAGRFINGKRTDLINTLESRCDPSNRTVSIGLRGTGDLRQFHLDDDRNGLEVMLAAHFKMSVQLVENAITGLPDDTDAPGPTIISTATLETVASWFDHISLDEARLRFRANLEIGGVEPFWEERLYAAAGQVVRFQVGGVALEGTNPCARCVVPMRDPATGEFDPIFKQQFRTRREATLPAWAHRSRFDHFYRLAINTQPVAGFSGGELNVGDDVQFSGAESS